MTRAFAAAAADLVLQHGPLSLPDLHAHARALGLTRSAYPESLRASLREGPYVLRPDGRYDAAARLLRGQVFTTRPRSGRHGDVLWTRRDLDPLSALPTLPLVHGGNVQRGPGLVEGWTGPHGWLPELRPGQLLGLRWDGAALEVCLIEDVPSLDSDVVRDVREVLSRHARVHWTQTSWPPQLEEPPTLRAVVTSALVEAPDLFAEPRPPLRELLPLPTEPHLLEDRHASLSGLRQSVMVPLADGVRTELTNTQTCSASNSPTTSRLS